MIAAVLPVNLLADLLRAAGGKPYTFDEISAELEAIGIERSERSLRTWRTKLVQDMTVLLFGVDGALSVEAREPKQGQKETITEGAKTDERAYSVDIQ